MVGQTISHYKILEKLGEGGMGVVYKAEDAKLRRSVALKFLIPEMTRDQEAKKRFMLEAQAASALDHPNIATVHEINETDDGRSFICMAYYKGKTLKEKIESGLLHPEEAIQIALQIADGLQRAHDAGIVHRDIKPGNIIITDRGEVKIVDFGLAKLVGGTKSTKSGRTPGTAAYMSPEQVQGSVVDHRSDLFSLGIVLYEMVTGRRPFSAEHETAIMYLIVNVDPPAPSTLVPTIPQNLENIILRLLQKDPTRRYQSASVLRSDLKKLNGIPETTQILKIKTSVIETFSSWKIAFTFVIFILVVVVFSIPLARSFLFERLGFETVPADKHLVVLPFTNVGGDPANQSLCDGLMETLTSALTQLRVSKASMWVVGSSEVREKKITSAAEAGRAFGATLAVTGSVQREEGRIRLTLNLVDARTSRQLKSHIFDQQKTTMAGMEDAVVTRLSEMLDVPLEGQTLNALAAGRTRNSAAFDSYLQARGYLQNFERLENINLAIELFKNAIGEDSLYALAFAGLGEAYWRKYDNTKDLQWVDPAVNNSNRALKLNDRLPPVYITLGLIDKGTGQYEDAVKKFQRALELDNVNADAYRELASAYEKLGDLEKVEATYRKAINLRPSYWAGYNNLGAFYYRRKRYADAIEPFRRVVELTPDNARGYSNLGVVYFKLERWSDAREMFERSITTEPTYAVYSNLATLYFYDGRYTDVARTYQKALALNDRDYVVWGNLASAYYWSDEHKKADTTFQRAARMAEKQRKVNPRDATVLSHLADYHAMMGKASEALNWIKQALILAPEDLEVIRRAADVYEQVGNRELALKWIEHGLKRGISIEEIKRAPALKDLRADVRFQHLLKNLGGKKP